MSSSERRVDWNAIKGCLSILQRESPSFLARSVLIGGAAVWFYRVQLEKGADSEFHDPTPKGADEEIWLSKDIDFTCIFSGDALELLPSLAMRDDAGRRFIEVNGIRLGFAQVGVVFDPDEAFTKARVAAIQERNQSVQFLVMDPVTLYREKQALALKRNQKNDRLHFALLREYLCWEFVSTCASFSMMEVAAVAEQRDATSFLLEIRNRAPEIAADRRVSARLAEIVIEDNSQARFIRETFYP